MLNPSFYNIVELIIPNCSDIYFPRVLARLEFELGSYYVAVQHVSLTATATALTILILKVKHYYVY